MPGDTASAALIVSEEKDLSSLCFWYLQWAGPVGGDIGVIGRELLSHGTQQSSGPGRYGAVVIGVTFSLDIAGRAVEVLSSVIGCYRQSPWEY